jgi:hypothetical protein
MSLSPQKVDFEAIWADLAEGVGKIVTLAGVKGMPMYEYVLAFQTGRRSLLVFILGPILN